MDIKEIQRDITISELVNDKCSKDVVEIIDIFKNLTIFYEKYGHNIETWFNYHHQWTLHRCENKTKINYHLFNFLEHKYNITYLQNLALIHGVLKIVLKRDDLPIFTWDW